MEKRRVVVTGIGMISPVGIGNDANWEALLAGRSGIREITRFDAAAFPCRIAGEVRGFDPEQWIDKKEVKKSDIFIHYAIAATTFAMDQSGLRIDDSNAERVGVIIGSGIGGLPLIEEMHRKLLERGPSRISPFFIPGLIINLAAGHVSIRWGAKGPNSAPATACATGAHAIGDAFKVIQRGDADAMIAGGAEAVVTPLAIGGFSAMRALSTRNDEPKRASRPWDRDRDGFVMGEGAGILVLEERQSAIARGAQILCELSGYGMTSDAHHITAPAEDGSGMMRVMQTAIRDAGIEPKQVDYVNAHGTSTPHGDRAETMALRGVFGEHASRLAVSSTKSMTGHLLGAAGGLEAAVCVRTIVEGMVPPTINYENPDPDCDLDYVPNTARKLEVRHALSNSFGFGGTNACLLFSKHEA